MYLNLELFSYLITKEVVFRDSKVRVLEESNLKGEFLSSSSSVEFRSMSISEAM